MLELSLNFLFSATSYASMLNRSRFRRFSIYTSSAAFRFLFQTVHLHSPPHPSLAARQSLRLSDDTTQLQHHTWTPQVSLSTAPSPPSAYSPPIRTHWWQATLPVYAARQTPPRTSTSLLTSYPSFPPFISLHSLAIHRPSFPPSTSLNPSISVMPVYHSSIVLEGKEHHESMRSISHTVANISLPIPRLPPQPPQ